MDLTQSLPFRHPDKPKEITLAAAEQLDLSDFIGQDKYDGWRLGVYVDGPNAVRLLTREGNRVKLRLPDDLMGQVANLALPAGTVLDAEFVGPRGDHEPCVYVFDCLAWAGQWLVDEHFSQRWKRCLALREKQAKFIRLANTYDDEFFERFATMRAEWVRTGKGLHLLEGIVFKRRTGTLQMRPRSCAKSQHMFKLKFRNGRAQYF